MVKESDGGLVAASGVGDGWGTGIWPRQQCLGCGVNKTAAACRFWEPWIWQEAKADGGGTGVLGTCFWGCWLWPSRSDWSQGIYLL